MKLFDVYPLYDVNIVKGKGVHVWDDKGQEYLDLYGGHAVISIGHCHPHYVDMLTKQLNQLGFYSNSVVNLLQRQLAERLGKICGYDDYQLFLINSGAEANENALKLASFHNGRTRVLSAEKAFHGRTSLAVEVTGNPKIVAPINDNGHVTFLPYNDLEAWERELAKGDVCASRVWAAAMSLPRSLHRGSPKPARNMVLCSSATRYSVATAARASSSPISGSAYAPTSSPWPRASAMASPWAPCSSRQNSSLSTDSWALRSVATIWPVRQHWPCSMSSNRSMYFINELKQLQKTEPHIKEVRGRGLMIGLVLDVPQKEVRSKLIYEQHVFTGAAGTDVLRILPPLCLTKADADDFIYRLKRVFASM